MTIKQQEHFELWIDKWCNSILRGNIDMSVLRERLIAGGLYHPPQSMRNIDMGSHQNTEV